MKVFKFWSWAMLPMACAAALFTGGCGGSSSYSYVKVIHASAGSPNIDVKIGGDYAVKKLAFGNASAAYGRVHSGTNRSVQIFAASKDSSPLVSAQRTLMKNQYYTVIAWNTPANLQMQWGNDDLTPPGTGNFKVRIVHGAITAGNVDVYITAPGAVIDDPMHPVPPTLTNVAFATVTSYLEVPAGTYEIRVTPTGHPSTVLMDTGSQGTVLPTGSIYTAVALDPDPNANGSTFNLLLSQDQPVAGVPPTAPSTP